MTAVNYVSLTNGLLDRFRIAAEMLLIGVAYQETGTLWRVYSFEGDCIGTMSTFMVNETAHMLKRKGLKSNHLRHMLVVDQAQSLVTFMHDPNLEFIPKLEIQAMADRRYRNPVNLL